MAAATACAFILAVKKDYFRDIEDTKYQVFWSDLEDPAVPPKESCQCRRRQIEDNEASDNEDRMAAA